MRRQRVVWTTLLMLAFPLNVMAMEPMDGMHEDAHAHHGSRADSHAPIGVMGEHVHKKGEVMFSYRFMRMSMRDNRDDTHRISPRNVLRPVGNFMVTPIWMDMEMHMLGVMYAPLDRLTLMAMLPYIRLDMEHRTAAGASFRTRSNGIGDAKLSALYSLWEGTRDEIDHQLILNAGISVPTGSISVKDNTPAGRDILPYPMQLGSGTPDLMPGLTYRGNSQRFSWGAQTRGTYRIGRNHHGYRLGHEFMITGWGAVNWCEWLSSSLRLEFDKWKDVVGDNGRLNPNMVPTADPNLRAGRQVDIGLGLNFMVPKGPLKGHRLGLEFLFPIHRSLDGPQLERDWIAMLGWQYAL